MTFLTRGLERRAKRALDRQLDYQRAKAAKAHDGGMVVPDDPSAVALPDDAKNVIGDAGVRALTASPHLRKLTALDLSDNFLGDAAVFALARCPGLRGLTALDVAGNYFGAAAVHACGRGRNRPAAARSRQRCRSGRAAPALAST